MIGGLYEYEGNVYILRESESAEMKTPRGWVSAVLYSPYFGSPFTIYVREKEDFFRKFKAVTHDEALNINQGKKGE